MEHSTNRSNVEKIYWDFKNWRPPTVRFIAEKAKTSVTNVQYIIKTMETRKAIIDMTRHYSPFAGESGGTSRQSKRE